MMRSEIFNERLACHWVRIDKVEYFIGNLIPQVFPLNQLYPHEALPRWMAIPIPFDNYMNIFWTD